MKQNKIIKTCFLLLLMFSSLNQIFCQDIPVIRIDPEKTFGGKVSEYFESVEYIPLETSKESLFGDIHQLLVTDSSFIILDKDTRAILIFNAKGKFIKKIVAKNGFMPVAIIKDIPNEKLIIGFENFRNKSKNPKIESYSLSGSNIQDVLNFNKFKNSMGYYYFSNGNHAVFNSCKLNKTIKPVDSVFYLLSLYGKDTLYKNLIPYNQKKNIGFCSIAGCLGNLKENWLIADTTYAATVYENKIYQITKDTATPYIQLIFPKLYTVDSKIFETEDKLLIDSLMTNCIRSRNLISKISNIIVQNEKIFFRTVTENYSGYYSSEGNLGQRNFVYDFKLGKLFSMERILPDKLSYFLPILTPEKTASKGITCYKNTFFTNLSSLEMFSARLLTKAKIPQYPPALKQYFETQNRRSNPVIVKMKLK